jgi:tetratricopeptide (TPR) repeat protein
MGSRRKARNWAVAILLLAATARGTDLHEQLTLEIVDLNREPLAGVVLLDPRGQTTISQSDSSGAALMHLDQQAQDSGWVRIETVSPPDSTTKYLVVSPWDGWIPIARSLRTEGQPVRIVAARSPLEQELLDPTIAVSVAAGILAQEALKGSSTTLEKGERQKTIELRAATLGLSGLALTESLEALSATARSAFESGIASLWRGDTEEAAEQLLETWKQVEPMASADPSAAVDTAQFLAITFQQRGEYGRSAFLLSKACDLRPDDLDLLSLLGKALHGAGNFTEAETVLRRVLEGRERVLGESHVSLSPVLNNLAVLLFEQGRYEEARQLDERALQIATSASEPDHPTVVALLTNLAAVHTALGDTSAAEPLLERALEIEEGEHGESGAELASALNNLAWVYFETGRLIEARNLYNRVLAIDRRASGERSPEVAADLSNLALVSDQVGAVFEAERLYRLALEMREELVEPSHPDLAKSYANLAWYLHRQHRFEEAEGLYLSALEVLEAAQGGDPMFLAWTLKSLGMLYQKLERYSEAEPLYRQSLEIFDNTEGAPHPDLVSLLWTMAALLEETDRSEEAELLEERARSLSRKEDG